MRCGSRSSQSDGIVSVRGDTPPDAGGRGGKDGCAQLEGLDQWDLRGQGVEGILCRLEYRVSQGRTYDEVSLSPARLFGLDETDHF